MRRHHVQLGRAVLRSWSPRDLENQIAELMDVVHNFRGNCAVEIAQLYLQLDHSRRALNTPSSIFGLDEK